MVSQSTNEIPTGLQKPSSTYGDYNNINFVIQQALNRLQTCTLVKIISCTNSGGVSPVGFVDIQPLVNQINGNGVATPHGVIHNVPYFRMQGGTNAIIIDPVAGDIGIALFANRDISTIKTTKNQANPGSYRTFSFSDALYIGGVLNGTPTQYVQFNSSGITINSPSEVNIVAPKVSISCESLQIEASSSVSINTPNFSVTGIMSASSGSVTVNGTLTTTEDVIANGISLHDHTHTSNSPGSPTSPPL